MFAMAIGLAFITAKTYYFGGSTQNNNNNDNNNKPSPRRLEDSVLIEVHFTAPSAVSGSLADGLVEKGLVACAQVRLSA